MYHSVSCPSLLSSPFLFFPCFLLLLLSSFRILFLIRITLFSFHSTSLFSFLILHYYHLTSFSPFYFPRTCFYSLLSLSFPPILSNTHICVAPSYLSIFFSVTPFHSFPILLNACLCSALTFCPSLLPWYSCITRIASLPSSFISCCSFFRPFMLTSSSSRLNSIHISLPPP